MWQQYKKTVVGIQVLICLVTLGVLVWSHHWDLALLFFVTMQVGAVLGAMWASRLRNKFQRNS